MRIFLTTLTISFFYALTAAFFSITHWTFGDFVYSFVMAFGFILIPLFICVFFFHFLLTIYRWTKRQPTLITQILTLWFVYNLTSLLISLPDFIRHQNNNGYLPYKSFAEYFMTNMLEEFINATIFAIAIPLLDTFFRVKFIKPDTSQKY